MVTKPPKTKAAKNTDAPLTDAFKDSAQQIWQAGLGAFSKAQAEASSQMSEMATGISSRASGQWDKLENIFEDRVAKALNKLGVPSTADINALITRIDELNKRVQKLSAKDPAAKTTKKAPAKAAPKKAVKAAPRV